MYTFEEMKREHAAHDMEDYISESLIAEICAYREIFNISQRDLSKLSGVTQPLISNMENGNKTPKLQTLAKLLDALELDVEIKVIPREKNDNLEKLDQEKLKKMIELSSKMIPKTD